MGWWVCEVWKDGYVRLGGWVGRYGRRVGRCEVCVGGWGGYV